MQLEGKVAIVTGAATNIGRETALLLAREGARVIVADLNEEDAQSTVADIGDANGEARFVRTDVSEAEDMRALMAAAERMGGIDIIVNNAGAQRSGAITDFDESEWDLLMRVNPRSCFLGAKYGVPYLRERGGGSIVNVSSLAGLQGGDHRVHQGLGRGACPGQHPRKLRVSGLDRHPVQRARDRIHGRARESGSDGAAGRASPTSGEA